MQQVELNVVSRKTKAKSELKDLRSKGFIPANIYGPGSKNASCAFSEKEIRKLFNNDFNSNFIINLNADAADLKGKKVVLKSMERDPVRWTILHADLYEISMDRPLVVSLPVHFNGTPDGVKNDGGILQVIRRTIRVKGLPNQLPDYIDVDISQIKLNDSLHIGEIKTLANLEVLDSKEFALVAVVEAEKEEAPVAAAAATPEGAAAPAEGAPAAAGDKAAATAAGDKAAAPAKGKS